MILFVFFMLEDEEKELGGGKFGIEASTIQLKVTVGCSCMLI